MLNKRKHLEPHLETFFAKAFSYAKDSKASNGTVVFLRELKKVVESGPTSAVHKPATAYTIDETVDEFGLSYKTRLRDAPKNIWKIDAEVKAIQASPCLESFLDKYFEVYDRSSEAACRVPLDLLLCECIAGLNGMTSGNEARPSTPQPVSGKNVKVYCEVSFTHTITNRDIVVGGRVDLSVAIVLPGKKERFHSLLLCVGAKFKENVRSALPQLVVYLASLRQSRINRGKSDSSVCGVATDGLAYIFLTITDEGDLLMSKEFRIQDGEMSIILGCFHFILKKAIARSPNPSPKQVVPPSEEMDDDDDDNEVINPLESSYLRSNDGDGENAE